MWSGDWVGTAVDSRWGEPHVLEWRWVITVVVIVPIVVVVRGIHLMILVVL